MDYCRSTQWRVILYKVYCILLCIFFPLLYTHIYTVYLSNLSPTRWLSFQLISGTEYSSGSWFTDVNIISFSESAAPLSSINPVFLENYVTGESLIFCAIFYFRLEISISVWEKNSILKNDSENKLQTFWGSIRNPSAWGRLKKLLQYSGRV